MYSFKFKSNYEIKVINPSFNISFISQKMFLSMQPTVYKKFLHVNWVKRIPLALVLYDLMNDELELFPAILDPEPKYSLLPYWANIFDKL